MSKRITTLTELADRLETLRDDQMDMSEGCGTAACIGRWAIEWGGMEPLTFIEDAVEELGMDYTSAYCLCYPPTDHPAWQANPRQAAAAVRLARDQGKFFNDDWDKIMGVEGCA